MASLESGQIHIRPGVMKHYAYGELPIAAVFLGEERESPFSFIVPFEVRPGILEPHIWLKYGLVPVRRRA